MVSMLIGRFPDIKENEVLAPYTTFRIGGAARYFLVVKNREDLIDALKIAKSEGLQWLIIGGGSNMLISSLGFDGLVIKNEMNLIEVHGDRIRAESGVVLATVIKTAKDNGLKGIAALQGVPGTFGGAVRGNAGVPGCEIGSFVESAILLDEHLHLKTVDQHYFHYGYRKSKLKHNKEIIIEATIKLTPGGDPEQIMTEMMEILKARKAKQPWGSSGGSYFKNPSKEYSAGFLVDKVQGKGMQVGGAQISDKHGNFFLNVGDATSADIQNLAQKIKWRVLYEYAILLEEEVEFVGKKPISHHFVENPILRGIAVVFLVVLGIAGCVLPVMPGLIFFVIAAYIISPKTSEYVARFLIQVRKKLEEWGKKEY